jgi:hypothetical protein
MERMSNIKKISGRIAAAPAPTRTEHLLTPLEEPSYNEYSRLRRGKETFYQLIDYL